MNKCWAGILSQKGKPNIAVIGVGTDALDFKKNLSKHIEEPFDLEAGEIISNTNGMTAFFLAGVGLYEQYQGDKVKIKIEQDNE